MELSLLLVTGWGKSVKVTLQICAVQILCLLGWRAQRHGEREPPISVGRHGERGPPIGVGRHFIMLFVSAMPGHALFPNIVKNCTKSPLVYQHFLLFNISNKKTN